MTADIAKSVQPTALRDAPHDYDTAQNQAGWRDGLAWLQFAVVCCGRFEDVLP